MKQTKIQPVKPYWVIAKWTTKKNIQYSDEHDQPDSYDIHTEIELVEFDTATELNDMCCDCSVSAGESEGTESFNILAQSHNNQHLSHTEDYEKGKEE